jgi:hypothetical protein
VRTTLLTSLSILTLLLLTATSLATETAETEITYLLNAIGNSGCAFVRNGKDYSATDAQDHLAMKYRRGKKYASTAEEFIERLASKSSWTGKPYQILCPGVPASNSGEWLTSQLEALRTSQ